MRRKLVRQGHNTLTVSLPKHWCKINNLKEGNEIDISEKLNCLLISKETFRGVDEVKIDITGLDRSTIILLIQSIYSYGHNAITITTKDSKVKHYICGKENSVAFVIQESISRLIGAEIISSSKFEYKIQTLTEDSREKFNIILRRIFLLINEMFNSFIEGVDKKDKTLIENISLQHINIKKFINYSLRLLNKFGYEQAEKTNFYFSIINFLGKIDEIIKNYAGYIINEGSLNQSKQFCSLVKKIGLGFQKYYECFYKYNLQKISEIHKERDLFKSNFYIQYKKLSKDDVFVLSGMTQIYDMILDLIELRTAIGH